MLSTFDMHGAILAVLIALSVLMLAPQRPAVAQDTIYSSDIEARVNPTEEQRPLLQSILAQNEAGLTAILRRNGIDPNNPTPEAQKIYRASGALSALGARTRGELAKVLEPDQMLIYDQIVSEVEQRIRRAVKFVGRDDASDLK